jgi:hypothetical protein
VAFLVLIARSYDMRGEWERLLSWRGLVLYSSRWRTKRFKPCLYPIPAVSWTGRPVLFCNACGFRDLRRASLVVSTPFVGRTGVYCVFSGERRGAGTTELVKRVFKLDLCCLCGQMRLGAFIAGARLTPVWETCC